MKRKLIYILIYVMGYICSYNTTKYSLNQSFGKYTKGDRYFNAVLSLGSWVSVVTIGIRISIDYLTTDPNMEKPANW